MVLAGILIELLLIVVTMLGVATLVLVGPDQFLTALRNYRWRLAAVAAPVGLLAAILLIRVLTQDAVRRLSWGVVGNPLTGQIFAVEQAIFPTNPVAFLQSFQSPSLNSFFVFIYIYGYVFLIVFPALAYFALEDTEELSALILAYTLNYGIGLIFYTLFIAYGPRNINPLLFENLLYESFPQVWALTDNVNDNTNVFPSLHTSLSMTVLFMAWLTREKYPLWLPISAFFSLSVVVATMYLGIHWFSDVVVGTALAAFSVYIGWNYTVADGAQIAKRYFEWGTARLSRTDRE